MKAMERVRGSWMLLVGFMMVFSMFGITAAYAADDEITVGVVGPLRFMQGTQMCAGANIAADELNAAGGITIKGKQYKFKVKCVDDNEFVSIPDAISAMERLATRDKLKYVVGGCSAEAIMALQDVTADNKMIHMSVGGGAIEITQRVAKNYNRYKYYFRVQSIASPELGITYIAHTVPIINALKKIGVAKPKIALITDQSAWTLQIDEIAKTLYPQLGCEIVGIWKTKHTASTYIAELSAAKSAGAQIIFHAMSGPPGNIIIRQWGELKIPAVLTGANAEAMKDVQTLWAATDGKANYVTVGGGLDAEITPTSYSYKAKFKKATGQEPSNYGYGPHDALYILADSMKRGQTLDPEALVPFIEKADVVAAAYRYKFKPVGSERPHEPMFGSEYVFQLGTQVLNQKRYVYWPDGKMMPAALDSVMPGASKMGLKKYPGTVAYVLPPFVADYWKSKK